MSLLHRTSSTTRSRSNGLAKASARRTAQAFGHSPYARSLRIEPLEDRQLLSVSIGGQIAHGLSQSVASSSRGAFAATAAPVIDRVVVAEADGVRDGTLQANENLVIVEGTNSNRRAEMWQDGVEFQVNANVVHAGEYGTA